MKRLAVTGAAVFAFADSAIVVLALPELVGRFDASVTGVSWVLNAYNLTAAVAALVAVIARPEPKLAATVGAGIFAFASIVCAVSPDLVVLVVARGLQGIGGALLLVGAARLIPRRDWELAGALGLAAGPALGGLLTQLIDWRAIFVAQVPFAVAALGVLAVAPRLERPRRLALPAARDVAHVLVAAALAGALFLTVILLVNGWSLTPLEAAALLTLVPAAGLAAALALHRFGARIASALGIAAIAAGLMVLGALSGENLLLTGLALLAIGAGTGLALGPGLPRLGLWDRDPDASWAIVARHAGLLLGCALLAPILASNLHDVRNGAVRKGASKVISAPIPVRTKLTLSFYLARAVIRTPNGELPDIDGAFNRVRGGASEEDRRDLSDLQTSLHDVVKDAVTRAFRQPYRVAALLALLALIPVALQGLLRFERVGERAFRVRYERR
ncbi:MAG TPA: MFS transporter [Gaiellaceae bacterium]|nr:MFS transporter [Gaiellaceae bacterium]